MAYDEFRKVILNIELEQTNNEMSEGVFERVVLIIPSEFTSSFWGYGHQYGRFYGHT